MLHEVIKFTRKSHKANGKVDLSAYMEQIDSLTEEIRNYAEFIIIQADQFNAEVAKDESLAEARIKTLLGYMNELNRKSVLMNLMSEELLPEMCA